MQKLSYPSFIVVWLILCDFQLNAQHSTFSHDHYWSVRPVSWLTFNPNFQLGSRLPCRDTSRRLYSEISFTYPLGKTYLDRTFYFSDISANVLALQVEQRFRFTSRFNRFWGPVLEADYRRYNYIHFRQIPSEPDMNHLDIRLGFENGSFKLNRKKQVTAIYWGLAARYTIDFANHRLHHRIGDKEYNYWGIKLYFNWQIGQGYKAAYPRNYKL